MRYTKDKQHLYFYAVFCLFVIILFSQFDSVDDFQKTAKKIHKDILEINVHENFTLSLKKKTEYILKSIEDMSIDWLKIIDETKETIKIEIDCKANELKEFINKTSLKLIQTKLEIEELLQEKKKELEDSINTGLSPDSKNSFQEIILSRGYPLEEHIIQTADGYLLKFFRIQSKKQKFCMPFKEAVLLQHGLIDSSDTWIANYDELTIPFLLAEKGFDVWLGNTRGNKHSRSHVWLDPDVDAKYWDFTWEDMSTYDLPAAFQYIHKITYDDKIDFIGHSQGGTIMIGSLAEQIEDVVHYLDRFIALGPVIYLSNPQTPIFKIVASVELKLLWEVLEIYEFFEANPITNPTTAYLCYYVPRICKDLVEFISDANSEIINKERLHVWTAHYPSGTSVKNLIHYQQMLLRDELALRKFDYGKEKNLIMYGDIIPPAYNLTTITQKFYLYAGLTDKMASIIDTRNAIISFPNAIYREIVAGHLSFLLGKDSAYIHEVIDILCNKPIISQMEKKK